MTRANIDIICGFPKKHSFEVPNSGYLNQIMPEIFKLIASCAHSNYDDNKKMEFYDNVGGQDLAKFIESCNLTLGHVGNFSYAYEIDFKKQTVRAWESTDRWVNAPINWKERGWVCNETRKGKAGYTTWVRGIKLVDLTFAEMVTMAKNTPEVEKETFRDYSFIPNKELFKLFE